MMVGEWASEWLEVRQTAFVLTQQSLTDQNSKFAKTMGETPTLPEEMGEAKRQAFNKIAVETAKLLPPPPDNVLCRRCFTPVCLSGF